MPFPEYSSSLLIPEKMEKKKEKIVYVAVSALLIADIFQNVFICA